MDFSKVLWRKSRRSTNGSCVELAPLTEGVAVRDSKNPDGAQLAFTRSDFRRLVVRVKANSLDL
jgi:hypothetical protein